MGREKSRQIAVLAFLRLALVSEGRQGTVVYRGDKAGPRGLHSTGTPEADREDHSNEEAFTFHTPSPLPALNPRVLAPPS